MQRQIDDTVVHYVEHGAGKPVLVLHGANVDHYPLSTLTVLDGAGHALPHEKPELLAQLFQDWLDRTDSSPRSK